MKNARNQANHRVSDVQAVVEDYCVQISQAGGYIISEDILNRLNRADVYHCDLYKTIRATNMKVEAAVRAYVFGHFVRIYSELESFVVDNLMKWQKIKTPCDFSYFNVGDLKRCPTVMETFGILENQPRPNITVTDVLGHFVKFLKNNSHAVRTALSGSGGNNWINFIKQMEPKWKEYLNKHCGNHIQIDFGTGYHTLNKQFKYIDSDARMHIDSFKQSYLSILSREMKQKFDLLLANTTTNKNYDLNTIYTHYIQKLHKNHPSMTPYYHSITSILDCNPNFDDFCHSLLQVFEYDYSRIEFIILDIAQHIQCLFTYLTTNSTFLQALFTTDMNENGLKIKNGQSSKQDTLMASNISSLINLFTTMISDSNINIDTIEIQLLIDFFQRIIDYSIDTFTAYKASKRQDNNNIVTITSADEIFQEWCQQHLYTDNIFMKPILHEKSINQDIWTDINDIILKYYFSICDVTQINKNKKLKKEYKEMIKIYPDIEYYQKIKLAPKTTVATTTGSSTTIVTAESTTISLVRDSNNQIDREATIDNYIHNNTTTSTTTTINDTDTTTLLSTSTKANTEKKSKIHSIDTTDMKLIYTGLIIWSHLYKRFQIEKSTLNTTTDTKVFNEKALIQIMQPYMNPDYLLNRYLNKLTSYLNNDINTTIKKEDDTTIISIAVLDILYHIETDVRNKYQTLSFELFNQGSLLGYLNTRPNIVKQFHTLIETLLKTYINSHVKVHSDSVDSENIHKEVQEGDIHKFPVCDIYTTYRHVWSDVLLSLLSQLLVDPSSLESFEEDSMSLLLYIQHKWSVDVMERLLSSTDVSDELKTTLYSISIESTPYEMLTNGSSFMTILSEILNDSPKLKDDFDELMGTSYESGDIMEKRSKDNSSQLLDKESFLHQMESHKELIYQYLHIMDNAYTQMSKSNSSVDYHVIETVQELYTYILYHVFHIPTDYHKYLLHEYHTQQYYLQPEKCMIATMIDQSLLESPNKSHNVITFPPINHLSADISIVNNWTQDSIILNQAIRALSHVPYGSSCHQTMMWKDYYSSRIFKSDSTVTTTSTSLIEQKSCSLIQFILSNSDTIHITCPNTVFFIQDICNSQSDVIPLPLTYPEYDSINYMMTSNQYSLITAYFYSALLHTTDTQYQVFKSKSKVYLTGNSDNGNLQSSITLFLSHIKAWFTTLFEHHGEDGLSALFQYTFHVVNNASNILLNTYGMFHFLMLNICQITHTNTHTIQQKLLDYVKDNMKNYSTRSIGTIITTATTTTNTTLPTTESLFEHSCQQYLLRLGLDMEYSTIFSSIHEYARHHMESDERFIDYETAILSTDTQFLNSIDQHIYDTSNTKSSLDSNSNIEVHNFISKEASVGTISHTNKKLQSSTLKSAESMSSTVIDDTEDGKDTSPITLRQQEIITLLQQEFEYDNNGQRPLEETPSSLRQKRMGTVIAEKIYSENVHFVMELLQNADDNTYENTVNPTFKLVLYRHACVIYNNEIGFQFNHIKAICDFCNSTKKDKHGYIGQKGIGFKSVFAVSDRPELHSNNYHIQFDREISMIEPIWVEESTNYRYPLKTDEYGIYYETCLRLNFDKKSIKNIAKLTQNILEVMDETLILFLRKIRHMILQDIQRDVSTRIEKCPITLNWIQVSVYRHRQHEISQYTHYWWIVRQIIQNINMYRNDVFVEESEIAIAVKFTQISTSSTAATTAAGATAISEDEEKGTGLSLCNEVSANSDGNIVTNISSACMLQMDISDSLSPVYAFLPTATCCFKFIIQGDFLLTANRESLEKDSEWNQTLLTHLSKTLISIVLEIITWWCYDYTITNCSNNNTQQVSKDSCDQRMKLSKCPLLAEICEQDYEIKITLKDIVSLLPRPTIVPELYKVIPMTLYNHLQTIECIPDSTGVLRKPYDIISVKSLYIHHDIYIDKYITNLQIYSLTGKYLILSELDEILDDELYKLLNITTFDIQMIFSCLEKVSQHWISMTKTTESGIKSMDEETMNTNEDNIQNSGDNDEWRTSKQSSIYLISNLLLLISILTEQHTTKAMTTTNITKRSGNLEKKDLNLVPSQVFLKNTTDKTINTTNTTNFTTSKNMSTHRYNLTSDQKNKLKRLYIWPQQNGTFCSLDSHHTLFIKSETISRTKEASFGGPVSRSGMKVNTSNTNSDTALQSCFEVFQHLVPYIDNTLFDTPLLRQGSTNYTAETLKNFLVSNFSSDSFGMKTIGGIKLLTPAVVVDTIIMPIYTKYTNVDPTDGILTYNNTTNTTATAATDSHSSGSVTGANTDTNTHANSHTLTNDGNIDSSTTIDDPSMNRVLLCAFMAYIYLSKRALPPQQPLLIPILAARDRKGFKECFWNKPRIHLLTRRHDMYTENTMEIHMGFDIIDSATDRISKLSTYTALRQLNWSILDPLVGIFVYGLWKTYQEDTTIISLSEDYSVGSNKLRDCFRSLQMHDIRMTEWRNYLISKGIVDFFKIYTSKEGVDLHVSTYYQAPFLFRYLKHITRNGIQVHTCQSKCTIKDNSMKSTENEEEEEDNDDVSDDESVTGETVLYKPSTELKTKVTLTDELNEEDNDEDGNVKDDINTTSHIEEYIPLYLLTSNTNIIRISKDVYDTLFQVVPLIKSQFDYYSNTISIEKLRQCRLFDELRSLCWMPIEFHPDILKYTPLPPNTTNESQSSLLTTHNTLNTRSSYTQHQYTTTRYYYIAALGDIITTVEPNTRDKYAFGPHCAYLPHNLHNPNLVSFYNILEISQQKELDIRIKCGLLQWMSHQIATPLLYELSFMEWIYKSIYKHIDSHPDDMSNLGLSTLFATDAPCIWIPQNIEKKDFKQYIPGHMYAFSQLILDDKTTKFHQHDSPIKVISHYYNPKIVAYFTRTRYCRNCQVIEGMYGCHGRPKATTSTSRTFSNILHDYTNKLSCTCIGDGFDKYSQTLPGLIKNTASVTDWMKLMIKYRNQLIESSTSQSITYQLQLSSELKLSLLREYVSIWILLGQNIWKCFHVSYGLHPHSPTQLKAILNIMQSEALLPLYTYTSSESTTKFVKLNDKEANAMIVINDMSLYKSFQTSMITAGIQDQYIWIDGVLTTTTTTASTNSNNGISTNKGPSKDNEIEIVSEIRQSVQQVIYQRLETTNSDYKLSTLEITRNNYLNLPSTDIDRYNGIIPPETFFAPKSALPFFKFLQIPLFTDYIDRKYEMTILPSYQSIAKEFIECMNICLRISYGVIKKHYTTLSNSDNSETNYYTMNKSGASYAQNIVDSIYRAQHFQRLLNMDLYECSMILELLTLKLNNISEAKSRNVTYHLEYEDIYNENISDSTIKNNILLKLFLDSTITTTALHDLIISLVITTIRLDIALITYNQELSLISILDETLHKFMRADKNSIETIIDFSGLSEFCPLSLFGDKVSKSSNVTSPLLIDNVNNTVSISDDSMKIWRLNIMSNISIKDEIVDGSQVDDDIKDVAVGVGVGEVQKTSAVSNETTLLSIDEEEKLRQRYKEMSIQAKQRKQQLLQRKIDDIRSGNTDDSSTTKVLDTASLMYFQEKEMIEKQIVDNINTYGPSTENISLHTPPPITQITDTNIDKSTDDNPEVTEYHISAEEFILRKQLKELKAAMTNKKEEDKEMIEETIQSIIQNDESDPLVRIIIDGEVPASILKPSNTLQPVNTRKQWVITVTPDLDDTNTHLLSSTISETDLSLNHSIQSHTQSHIPNSNIITTSDGLLHRNRAYLMPSYKKLPISPTVDESILPSIINITPIVPVNTIQKLVLEELEKIESNMNSEKSTSTTAIKEGSLQEDENQYQALITNTLNGRIGERLAYTALQPFLAALYDTTIDSSISTSTSTSTLPYKVTWMNENQETSLPYDILIELPNNIKKRCEVKTKSYSSVRDRSGMIRQWPISPHEIYEAGRDSNNYFCILLEIMYTYTIEKQEVCVKNIHIEGYHEGLLHNLKASKSNLLLQLNSNNTSVFTM